MNPNAAVDKWRAAHRALKSAPVLPKYTTMGAAGVHPASEAAACCLAALQQPGSQPAAQEALRALLPGAAHCGITLAVGQAQAACLCSGNLLGPAQQASLLAGAPTLAGACMKERKPKLLRHG